MKTQQQAEKEEQQRIKNLVLNYDLRESEEPDGDTTTNPLLPNANIHNTMKAGHEKTTTFHINRPESKGKSQRIRRLEMNDLDWYGNSRKANSNQQAPDAESSAQAEASDEIQPAQSASSKRNGPHFLSKREGTRLGSRTRRERVLHATRRPRTGNVT